MAAPILTSPVKDTVPKVNNEIAVGEDVEFQRRWWKFEKAVWIFFTIFVLADVSGALGRGPLSKAHAATPDGAMRVTYERIERTGTPSTLMVKFDGTALQDHQVRLWASEDMVTKLGNKEIAPQPATSTVGDGGIHYTFPVTSQPATAVFSLQPHAPGIYQMTLRVSDASELHFKIVVMP